MAPQEHIPTAANVLGVRTLPTATLDAVSTDFFRYRPLERCTHASHSPVLEIKLISPYCFSLWCIQMLPQIWHNWRRKKTDGLPGLMIFLWAACAPPFGVYAIVQNFNIPIQIQPHVFGTLTLICWAQTLIYHNHWKVWKASLLTFAVFLVFGGIEAALILTLRGPYSRGVSWPFKLVGIIAAVLLAAGLIPPYFELWKRSGRVIGINFIFLIIDWNGAFFSLLSLAVQQYFDIIGGVCYIACIFLESGIFISHFLWMFRTRRLRAEAKRAGKTFDEYVSDCKDSRSSTPSPGTPFDMSSPTGSVLMLQPQPATATDA